MTRPPIERNQAVEVCEPLTAQKIGSHSVRCTYLRNGALRFVDVPREILRVVVEPPPEKAEMPAGKVYTCSCGKSYTRPTDKGACMRRGHKPRTAKPRGKK